MNAELGSIASAAKSVIKYALIGHYSRKFYKHVIAWSGEFLDITSDEEPNASTTLFNTPSEAIKAAQRWAPSTNFDIARVTVTTIPGSLNIVKGLDGEGEFVLEVLGVDKMPWYVAMDDHNQVTHDLAFAQRYDSVAAAARGAQNRAGGRMVLNVFRVVKTAPKVEYSFEVLK